MTNDEADLPILLSSCCSNQRIPQIWTFWLSSGTSDRACILLGPHTTVRVRSDRGNSESSREVMATGGLGDIVPFCVVWVTTSGAFSIRVYCSFNFSTKYSVAFSALSKSSTVSSNCCFRLPYSSCVGDVVCGSSVLVETLFLVVGAGGGGASSLVRSS